MMTWTPTEWGSVFSMFFGSYYGGKLLFYFVCGLLDLGQVHSIEVNVTRED